MSLESQGVLKAILDRIGLSELIDAYQLMMESKQKHDPNTQCLFCGQPSGEDAIVFDRDLGGPFCSNDCMENQWITISHDG